MLSLQALETSKKSADLGLLKLWSRILLLEAFDDTRACPNTYTNWPILLRTWLKQIRQYQICVRRHPQRIMFIAFARRQAIACRSRKSGDPFPETLGIIIALAATARLWLTTHDQCSSINATGDLAQRPRLCFYSDGSCLQLLLRITSTEAWQV